MNESSGQTSCLPISAPSFPEPVCANFQAHVALQWRPEPLSPFFVGDLTCLHRVYGPALARTPQTDIMAVALDGDRWRVAEALLPKRSTVICAWWSLVVQRMGAELANRLVLLRFDHAPRLQPKLADLELVEHLAPLIGRDGGRLADIVLFGREQVFSFADCGLLHPSRQPHIPTSALHPDECCLHEG